MKCVSRDFVSYGLCAPGLLLYEHAISGSIEMDLRSHFHLHNIVPGMKAF